jgi:hypothetical protein
MMVRALLATTLAATALALPGPRQLTVHPAVNATSVERMIKECDVRGKFGDGVSLTDEGESLLVSFGECAAAPAGAVPLGVLNTTQEYYVLLECVLSAGNCSSGAAISTSSFGILYCGEC